MHDLGYFPHTAMKCPDLENPMNGRVNVKKQTLDSTAKYECNDGFILDGGDRVRRCLAGGSWSGKAPLCECKFISWLADQSNTQNVVTNKTQESVNLRNKEGVAFTSRL